MMKVILAGVVAFTATACARKPDASVKRLLDGGAMVVDVRTLGEFAAGHHPRAINIPVDEVESRLAEFGDKKKPVVLYCQSGSRSGRAQNILEANGFTAVTNAGGYKDLP